MSRTSPVMTLFWAVPPDDDSEESPAHAKPADLLFSVVYLHQAVTVNQVIGFALIAAGAYFVFR
jgi:drug/metabolite transporter (DMT)-like permease